VIIVSIFFGLYLFALDFGIDSLVIWIMRKFGVGA
jgi:preprotein translocase subunit SecE